MARIRKADRRESQEDPILWKVGKYIRLSREDGNDVSESVVNQAKILSDELPNYFEDGMYEVVDTYVDDGTSGTTDIEREDFQRMVHDVTSGRINCIVVKNLSRAFRNSANQGKFLEEFIPLYQTRFISLYQPQIDTFLEPEVVHSLEVSIMGFMNEQYAYKTSCDVRRTLRYKRGKGEFVGAYAPYGYAKDPRNKNLLIVDEDAAEIVRSIFSLFVTDGMSKQGIAKRLNELGIPNPAAYKRRKDSSYKGPYSAKNSGLWSAHTISNMLQNPLYIGTLQQGKQRVVSYKVHKVVRVPESEWAVVEGVVPPIVDRAVFDAAQNLHRRDTRTPAGQSNIYLFSGFVRCADCRKALGRHSSKGYAYYGCRTYQEQSKKACSRHNIRLDVLERAVLISVRKQIELSAALSDVVSEIDRAPAACGESARLSALLDQKRMELEKTSEIADSLYLDWKHGDISHEQYRRMKLRMEEQISQLRETAAHIEREYETAAQDVDSSTPYLAAFLKYRNVSSLTRGLLAELVNVIYVHGDGSVDIEFNFADQYRRIAEPFDGSSA